MATQLTVVNNILRRLRETEVSSVASTTYSKFIGQLVNDAMQMMNDRWYWTVNLTSYDTSILGDSSTVEYNLASTNNRSFLVRSARNDKLPMAYDITDGEEFQLSHVPETVRLETINGYKGSIPAVPIPTEFSLVPQTDGTWTIKLTQAASGARTWRTWWYVPQDELALDGSDNSTTLNLPSYPVEMLALYKAQYERGEAQPGGPEELEAHAAMAAAMEIDMQTNLKSDIKDITNLELLRNTLSGFADTL